MQRIGSGMDPRGQGVVFRVDWSSFVWPPYLLPLRSAISKPLLVRSIPDRNPGLCGSWQAIQCQRVPSIRGGPAHWTGKMEEKKGTESIWGWSLGQESPPSKVHTNMPTDVVSHWYPIMAPNMDVYGALGRVPDGTPSPTSCCRNARHARHARHARPGQPPQAPPSPPRDVTMQRAHAPASRGRWCSPGKRVLAPGPVDVLGGTCCLGRVEWNVERASKH